MLSDGSDWNYGNAPGIFSGIVEVDLSTLDGSNEQQKWVADGKPAFHRSRMFSLYCGS
jgi:hypothetical protein